MSRIDDLVAELCPDGVPRRELGSFARRNGGTSITAARMKSLALVPGPVRVFGGGQTIADVAEGVVPSGDVVRTPSIIVKSRGNIGFVYYEKPFTHKSELWSYTVDTSFIDQKFVYYYLLTQVDRLQGVARATSVKLPQLGVKDTDTLRIPVPPLEVQQEIVKILDQFTQLEAELEAELEARRRQFAHYRDMLVSAANDAVWAPMGEVGEFFRGRRFTKSDVVEGGLASIHYGEIYTGYGTFADRPLSRVSPKLFPALRFARKGDVVIAAVGETVEDVAKAVAWLGNEQVAIHDDTFAFRHSLNPKFVSYFFQTERFHSEKNRHVARAKVKRISGESLAKISIPVPPRDEQDRIVAILDDFDALVNDLSVGLPAELAARRKQYAYYRDRLLTFKEAA